MQNHFYTTAELIKISGLSRYTVENLQKKKILVPDVKKPVKWKFKNIFLASLISTLHTLMGGRQANIYVKSMVDKLFDTDIWYDPFLVFATDEMVYLALTYTKEDEIMQSFDVVESFHDNNELILKLEDEWRKPLHLIDKSGVRKLTTRDLYVVNIERLRNEIAYRIDHLYDTEMELSG